MDDIDPKLLFGAALAGQLQAIESTIADKETSEATRQAQATIRRAKSDILRAAQTRAAAPRMQPQMQQPPMQQMYMNEELPPNLDSIGDVAPIDISQFQQPFPAAQMPQVAGTRRIQPGQTQPMVVQQPPRNDDNQMLFEFEKKGSNKVVTELENVYYAIKKADENLSNKLNRIIALLEQLTTNDEGEEQ